MSLSYSSYFFLAIIFFAGFACLFGFYKSFTRIRRLKKNGIVTDGTITGFDDSSTSKGRSVYAPKVSFLCSDAVIHFTSDIYSTGSRNKYKIGDKVKVLYAENDPHNAAIDSFFYLWGSSLFFLLGGLVFTLIGAYLLYSSLI